MAKADKQERGDEKANSAAGDQPQTSAGRTVSGQGPGTLRAQPGPHDRAGRQGGLRLGRAARARRGPRHRRRAGRRHGQDLLQADRILAVRSAARAGGADAAVLRLYRRLDQHHPPRRRGEQPAEAGRARARRQALPGSRMGPQRLLRFPQADLSRHLALGGRPRRAMPKGSTSTPGTRPASTSSRSPTRSRRPTSSSPIPSCFARPSPRAARTWCAACACWPKTSPPAKAT